MPVSSCIARLLRLACQASPCVAFVRRFGNKSRLKAVFSRNSLLMPSSDNPIHFFSWTKEKFGREKEANWGSTERSFFFEKNSFLRKTVFWEIYVDFADCARKPNDSLTAHPTSSVAVARVPHPTIAVHDHEREQIFLHVVAVRRRVTQVVEHVGVHPKKISWIILYYPLISQNTNVLEGYARIFFLDIQDILFDISEYPIVLSIWYIYPVIFSYLCIEISPLFLFIQISPA